MAHIRKATVNPRRENDQLKYQKKFVFLSVIKKYILFRVIRIIFQTEASYVKIKIMTLESDHKAIYLTIGKIWNIQNVCNFGKKNFKKLQY